jgi:hypothetical protein
VSIVFGYNLTLCRAEIGLTEFINSFKNRKSIKDGGHLIFVTKTYQMPVADIDVILNYVNNHSGAANKSLPRIDIDDFQAIVTRSAKLANEVSTKLVYHGQNFKEEDTTPSIFLNDEAKKHFKFDSKEYVQTKSYYDGTYTSVNPLLKQAQVSSVPVDSQVSPIISIDPTLADYTNLTKVVKNRTINFDKTGNLLTVTFKMTEKGYENQSYLDQDGTFYLTGIEALMGKSGLKVDKQYFNFQNFSDEKISTMFPAYQVSVEKPVDGNATITITAISEWSLEVPSNNELLIEVAKDYDIMVNE